MNLTIGMADGRTSSYSFLQAIVPAGAGTASASRSPATSCWRPYRAVPTACGS
ncbi:MAG: hypothetical protein U0Q11_11035 [Vicinamibacterales bacterium]